MNKVALVTGAGRRIGGALAEHLASRGFDIFVHYFSSAAGAHAIESQIKKFGRKAYLIKSDLRELYSPQEIIEAVKKETGQLDLLINNASTFPDANSIESNRPLDKETELDWEETFAVNCRAPFFLTKYAATLLAKNPGSGIINLVDESVRDPFISRATYSLSKSTLAALTTLTAKTFPDIGCYSFLLGSILPGEGMSKHAQEYYKWVGLPRVLNEVDNVLSGTFPTGSIIEII